MVKPSLRKKMAYEAVQHKAVSIRFACAAFQISETCYRYQHQLSDGNALITRWLLALTQEHRDWGFGLCFAYIRNVQGLRFNHKRVYRIYCELALNLRIKPKRRIKRPVPDVLKQPTHINDIWSLDFMHDQMSDGQSYRLLNIIDDYKREGLAMEVGLSLPASRVIRTLNRLLEYKLHHKPYAVIMAQNLPVMNFNLGPYKKASALNTYNQASHSKTLILSAITAPSGMGC